jgi:hypothetical protein
MKYVLALSCAVVSYALISVNAQAGFIACTAENGKVFVAGLDGEANVSNLRVIDASTGPESDTPLQLEAVSLVKTFLLVVKHELPEESIIYTIRAKSKNGVSEATFTEQAGEFLITHKGSCTVDFSAGV